MVVLGAGETVHGHVATRWKGRPAVLTLTNRRLVVSRRTGLPRRTDRTLLSVDWPSVRRTSVESREGEPPLLVLETGDGGPDPPRRVELPVEEPLRVQRSVDRLVEASLPPPPKEARAGGPSGSPVVHIHLTVHRSPGTAPPGPVYVRCGYCRTVYPEVAGKCPSCGAPF